MKKITLFLVSLVAFCFSNLQAQGIIHDSVDVLHYDLDLDIGNNTFKRIEGSATVTMRIVQPVSNVALELTAADIDSVLLNGTATSYSFMPPILSIPVNAAAGDTLTVTVFYRKGQHIMLNGWGGFYFDNNIYYNLGIAIYEYPHNVGKTWFPCRDNFYDKATYTLRITAKPGWRAICSGMKTLEVEHDDGSLTTTWQLNQPTPTYLVGVAVAPFHVIERNFEGFNGNYPAILGFLQHDSVNVWNAFDHMGPVISMFERCFGPYRWERVGYVSTPLGSMEHSANIAFTTSCMSSSNEDCLATMCHEFAHSWFGNLITCSTSEDMWINEGGASFCEELAIKAICPGGDSLRYKSFADENLNDVLCQTHVRDNGFRPLYGVTPDYTYGSTVYNKGATVWHSLRGYVGDSLFYASMQRLFNRCAFGNLDSYQLRDSLSLYTGIDLTDFFDFHVFGPGFCDYIVDSIHNEGSNTTVFMRQKTYGTDVPMNGNRVWVSFFSPELDIERRLVIFDGTSTSATFSLPFTPAFAIADYDKALSKASIGTELKIKATGSYELPNSHFIAAVNSVGANDSAWLYVTHHWTRPDTSLSPQFLRMADHYWSVTGNLPSSVKLFGRFHSCRLGQYASLDNDLYASNQIDQVRLLYRPTPNDDWKVVSSMHNGSGTDNYFVYRFFKLGEYTLALVDTSYVGINSPETLPGIGAVKVFPNPSRGQVTISTDEPGEPLSVEICDSTGRIIRKGVKMTSGESADFSLPEGNYVFKVMRLNSNLLDVVKVQFMNF